MPNHDVVLDTLRRIQKLKKTSTDDEFDAVVERLDEIFMSDAHINAGDNERLLDEIEIRPGVVSNILEVLAHRSEYEDFCDVVAEQYDDIPECMEASDVMSESIEALEVHLQGFEFNWRTPVLIEIESGWASKRNVSIRAVIGFNDPRSQPMFRTWDVIERRFENPAAGIITFGLHPLMPGGTLIAPRKLPEFNEMTRFHPPRYRQSRSYVDSVVQADVRSSGLSDFEHAQIVGQLIVNATNEALALWPIRHHRPHSTVIINTETTSADFYRKYVHSGHQIFELPPAMVEMFRHTGVDDVPLDMLKSPYECIYLHFPGLDDLVTDEGWTLSGCYVAHHVEHEILTFLFTFSPPVVEDSLAWPVQPEPQYVKSFDGEIYHMDAARAIDEVFAEEMALHQHEMGEGQAQSEREVNHMRETARATGVELPAVEITKGERAKYERHIKSQRHPIAMKGMRLAINALCYLTMYPNDRREVWPKTTPARLHKQAVEGSSKQAKRAQSRLESLGYTPVHLCGQELQRRMLPESDSAAGTTQVTKHWRRGHWRRQAHGKGRKLRKLVWLMPTLVGRSVLRDEAEEAKGHVYLVS